MSLYLFLVENVVTPHDPQQSNYTGHDRKINQTRSLTEEKQGVNICKNAKLWITRTFQKQILYLAVYYSGPKTEELDTKVLQRNDLS